MKRLRYIIIPAISLALTFAFPVQSAGQVPDYYNLYGYVMSRNMTMPLDLIGLSQYNAGFGTARSAAMGGAFTSLGGDMSSMNLNPAGLGMYRSSEVSFTPAFTFGKAESSYTHNNSNQSTSMYGGNKTRFTFNNVGVAFNLYQGSGGLTSFTLGFAYNKLADYNYKASISWDDDGTSLSDIFAHQLTAFGTPDNLGNPWWNYDISMAQWGSILGYQTGLLQYYSDDGAYYPTGMNDQTTIGHRVNTLSRGCTGEYSIAGGFNVQNKVYLGFSIGIQDIYQKLTTEYQEVFDSPGYPGPVSSRVDQMSYSQHRKISGVGYNFKFGVIYRPIQGLRIGMAVHTPTYTYTDTYYGADMAVYYGNGRIASRHTVEDKAAENNYRTPTRLMTGISYAFGSRAVISFDYERTWYDGVRLRDTNDYYDPYDYHYIKDDFSRAIKNSFKPANTFRVGAEFKPVNTVSLRAGFAYMGSMLKDKSNFFDAPMPYESYNISGGAGFFLGRNWTLDVAYVFMNTKYTDYDMYYFDLIDTEGESMFGYGNDGLAGMERNAHNIMLTFGYRF